MGQPDDERETLSNPKWNGQAEMTMGDVQLIPGRNTDEWPDTPRLCHGPNNRAGFLTSTWSYA